MLMLVMMNCMPDCGAMTGIDTHPPSGTGLVHGMEDSNGHVFMLGITEMHKYVSCRYTYMQGYAESYSSKQSSAYFCKSMHSNGK